MTPQITRPFNVIRDMSLALGLASLSAPFPRRSIRVARRRRSAEPSGPRVCPHCDKTLAGRLPLRDHLRSMRGRGAHP